MEPAIEKEENNLEYSDKETLSLNWARERSLHERANMINTAEERGFKKGFEQGFAQVVEQCISQEFEEVKNQIAISLLDVLDDETIASKIGLDIKTVKRFREDFMKK